MTYRTDAPRPAALTRPAPHSDRAFSIGTIAVLLAVVIFGLPVAVWLDLRALSEQQITRQASELSDIIDDLRDFYAENVVARAVTSGGPVTASHRYFEREGSIPIPATFSLELVSIFSGDGDTMAYRFVSDHRFTNRTPHILTSFERQALDRLIADPGAQPFSVTGGYFDRTVHIATPVLMGQACVDCHNAHPESAKRDWEVGDVRGIQAITVRQDLGDNIFAFRFLLIYFGTLIAVAVFVLARLRAQSADLQDANSALSHANDFLASVSKKVSRYISPKVYRRIFSGYDDDDVKTDRRKLSIFFSDLQGFTEISERLQPEELTDLLNVYFTEMAAIAEAHGGTLDKFVGDAVLVFFGDPYSNGVREDARACFRMALAMRRRVDELTLEWKRKGIVWPFKVRMALNTGYCNVGNFGSEDRLSYTIIGAEVNLTSRLQEHCAAGEIALAEETYVHVHDMAPARKAPPFEAKGIPYPVSYYVVSESQRVEDEFKIELSGLKMNLNLADLSEADQQSARLSLQEALSRLNKA